MKPDGNATRKRIGTHLGVRRDVSAFRSLGQGTETDETPAPAAGLGRGGDLLSCGRGRRATPRDSLAAVIREAIAYWVDVSWSSPSSFQERMSAL